jgi:hypothetical protein
LILEGEGLRFFYLVLFHTTILLHMLPIKQDLSWNFILASLVPAGVGGAIAAEGPCPPCTSSPVLSRINMNKMEFKVS